MKVKLPSLEFCGFIDAGFSRLVAKSLRRAVGVGEMSQSGVKAKRKICNGWTWRKSSGQQPEWPWNRYGLETRRLETLSCEAVIDRKHRVHSLGLDIPRSGLTLLFISDLGSQECSSTILLLLWFQLERAVWLFKFVYSLVFLYVSLDDRFRSPF